MKSVLKRRVVMTAQSQKIVDDLHSRIVKLEALNATLSEALAEAEKKGAEDWQPIETAPRDGALIDLWARRETTGKFDRYTECQWGRRNFGSEPYGEPVWLGLQDQYSVITPTHWRPLPAPPRDLSQGGQHG